MQQPLGFVAQRNTLIWYVVYSGPSMPSSNHFVRGLKVFGLSLAV